MEINISNLPEGTRNYLLEGTLSEVGLETPFAGSVTANVILEKSLQQFSLKVSASCNRNYECDRCLKEFSSLVTAEYRAVYAWENEEVQEKEQEEFHLLSPGANIINISGDVREFLLLAIPQKVLCSEECKGLCPKCGTNWNDKTCNCKDEEIDDRWSALKKLKSLEN